MKRTTTKRKGFTLVELLIVIVVIGILSAMMMLSSTEAVTSAKASNIVSNLRNLKTAALAYYTDNMDDIDGGKVSPDINKVWKYMSNTAGVSGDATGATSGVQDANKYELTTNTVGWFLSYTINGTNSEITQIKQKLKGRAKSVGLLNSTSDTSTPYDGTATDNKVYYFVR